MMDREVKEYLSKINTKVIERIAEDLSVGKVVHAPIRDIFYKAKSCSNFTNTRTPTDLASMGDPKYRRVIKDKIFNIIAGELKVRERYVDKILEGYHINYYGKPSDMSSSSDVKLLCDQLNKILIPRDSDLDVKWEKLSQVIFQECYGYGVLDEFMNLGVSKDFKKVEEISASGGDQLLVKISGLDFKLDRIQVENSDIERITNRLSKCSDVGLTKANNKIETELLNNSRVTLTCPSINEVHSFNIRLHYGGDITPAKKVEIGSTTWECEAFYDNIMPFAPRLLVIGGQGVGKSTDIRELCARYPRNTSVVTVETSFELSLNKVPHLYVNRLRAGVATAEEIMALCFRLNAKTLVLGEARSPEDIMMYTQLTKRQQFGSVSTWHSSKAIEAIYDMANGLIRGGYFTDQDSALEEICKCLDIVIVKDVCGERSKKPGLRHISHIVEVPEFKKGEPLELRTLFQYDYEAMKLKNVAPISKNLQDDLLSRKYMPDLMEVLSSGEYI